MSFSKASKTPAAATALAMAVINADWVSPWENSAYLAVVRECDGSILAVNRSFALTFGRPAASWLGSEFALLCHPSDKRAWLEQVSQLAEMPHRIEHQSRWQTAKGMRWIDWEETGILNEAGELCAFRAIGRDITEERQVGDQSSLLSRTVEQAPAGILITNLEGQAQYANPCLLQTLGCSFEELVNLKPSLLRLTQESERAYSALLERLTEGSEWTGECKLGLMDRANVWLRARLSPLRQRDGSVSQLLCLFEDISERKRLEAQLRQAQKMESLGLLAGGIAHDFNNMLAIINGYAEVLLGRSSIQQDEPTKRCMREIHNAAQRAVGLVQRILTFSRKTEVSAVPIKVNKMLRELGILLSETFPRTIAFDFDLADGLPDLVADQNQLQQVVMNLCVNARDAMTGGGRLGVASRLVLGPEVPGCDTQIPHICIEISDTGSGIPPAVLQRIFEPFFTTKQDSGGTGLGLAMVYGIVQGHNGQLDVQSQEGEGTVFRVYFPVQDKEEADPAAAQPTLFAGFPSGSEAILVVEDEISLRNLLCNVLGPCGYTVRTAADGREALAMIRDRSLELDGIILDLNMPNVHGVEVYREIVRLRPQARVLVVSGNISPEVQAELGTLGQKDFMTKPYRLEDICGRLRQVLDRR